MAVCDTVFILIQKKCCGQRESWPRSWQLGPKKKKSQFSGRLLFTAQVDATHLNDIDARNVHWNYQGQNQGVSYNAFSFFAVDGGKPAEADAEQHDDDRY